MPDREVVIPRALAPVVGLWLAGLAFTVIGFVLLGDRHLPLAAVVMFLAIGLPLVLSNTRLLIARPPRLRAGPDGVWFGGGRAVPWTDIKQIYASSFDVRTHGVTQKTAAIAFDFHRRATLFRLPVALWLASPFGVGDVDVSPGTTAGSTSSLVATLDAYRARAVGEAGT